MRDPDQWQAVRRWFHSALEIAPQERRSFLASAAEVTPEILEEVLELLEHHDAPKTILDAPVVGPAGDVAPTTRIGPYEIRDVLGRGGMGTVYRAERVDGAYRTEVAIKLLHPDLFSPELEERFRLERQILADLEHSSIARLLDGGVTDDGRQYLVLEYVEGERIDRYCDRHRLTVGQRLELFRRICPAVHFAHQNLVVHRDLKPANILVTAEGELKLLDFGIAKLLGSSDRSPGEIQTLTAMTPMTPEFASPEQMLGKPVTTACDIYALGALLYLLLAGRRPFELAETSPQSFIHAVCFEDPTPLSQAFRQARGRDDPEGWKLEVAAGRGTDAAKLEKVLAGDLADITAKALRKEPRSRYLSAEELSWDVGRYLEGKPVLARDQTFWYRAGKFIRRHRWAVTAAATAAVASTVFVGALLVQQARVLEERSRGEEVTKFLEGLFEISAPDRARGERVTARELLDRGALDIQTRLQEQPILQARLLATMGRVYGKLGLLDEAEPLLRQALELRRAGHGVRSREEGESLVDLGEHLLARGDYASAAEHFHEGRRLLTQGGAYETEVRAVSGLSRAFQRQGEYQQAKRLRLDGLALAQLRLGSDHDLVAVHYQELGGLLREQGEYLEAAEAYGQALEIYRKLYGDRHPSLAALYNDLGLLFHEQGEFERARESFSQAMAIQTEVYDENHPELATVRHNLADLLLGQGQVAKAEELALQALKSRQATFGARHPEVADTLNLLSLIRHRQGDLPGAAQAAQEALEMWATLLGEDYVKVGAARNNLARILQDQGDFDGAERQFTQALEIYRKAFGDDHLQVATVLSNRAFLAKERGDLAAAREGYESAAEILRRVLGPDHPSVATVTHNLAVLLESAGDLPAAEAQFRLALASFSASLPADHVNLGVVRKNLASTLVAQHKGDEAAEVLLPALAIFAKAEIEANDRRVLSARGLLGEARVLQGRYPEAEEILFEAHERARQNEPSPGPAVAKARSRLLFLYQAWGRPEQAAKFRGPDAGDKTASAESPKSR